MMEILLGLTAFLPETTFGAGKLAVVRALTDYQKEGKSETPPVKVEDLYREWPGFEKLLNGRMKRVLDLPFLLKHHSVESPSELCSLNVSGQNLYMAKENDFVHFDSVIYINASENLLPLEAFHTFPALEELELSFNGIGNVCIRTEDFQYLEVLDLSYNSLSPEAIYELGILPRLKTLFLTGNGLTSLPSNMAVAMQDISVISLMTKSFILRFPVLETLMLDENNLSRPDVFASLAGLRRLKKLNLDKNRITRIPYLQQIQTSDEPEEPPAAREVVSQGQPAASGLGPASAVGPRGREAGLRPGSRTEKGQLDRTVRPTRKGAGGTEGVSSLVTQIPPVTLAASLCPLAPIFKILPAKSLRVLDQKLVPPFPELMHLSLAWNKVSKEDALLAVALFPSLNELVFHSNPLASSTRGDPPMLNSFLHQRLGIKLIRKMISKPSKCPVFISPRANRKVQSFIPKVPRGPRVLGLSATQDPRWAAADDGGPLPAIGSAAAGPSRQRAGQSGEGGGSLPPCREDTPLGREFDSFFVTQASTIQSSPWSRKGERGERKLKGGDKSRRRAKGKVKESRKTEKSVTVAPPGPYRGYEELLQVKPDPDFVEPVGLRENVRALRRILARPGLYGSGKMRPDPDQTARGLGDRKVGQMMVPAPRRAKTQLLEDVLTCMRAPGNITETPLVSALRNREQRRYREAVHLLKEFQVRYKQMVRSTLSPIFGGSQGASAVPPCSVRDDPAPGKKRLSQIQELVTGWGREGGTEAPDL
ncbi:X-ray radiation resistance-associated protein 1 isoform X2 [Ornithorhynchus anatinus]|uniref:X-ray radiation resistance-associated protein 1 isoform X2 n=1 Tax=Ornithorhynchus anatinus TaxID=9258 RepID=UPI0019D440DF|nr:X-ray radiation resistance-associated protein 1 isoform X2 [Ornithorhynchus anatinus]XP_039767156.1 X-ray radiation resistance-associated protein 1 isoform X2 [Ornithorhynchus anatinus]